MNELKPEDVMMALECCSVYENCDGCPHFDGVPEDDCHYKAMANALALLREKDARIKELEEAVGAEFTCFVGEQHKVDHCPYGDELARLQKEVAEKDAEIEALRKTNRSLIKVEKKKRIDLWKRCRSQTITEFEERVKQGLKDYIPFGLEKIFYNTIDQIAKEMKGEIDVKSDL